MSGLFSDVAARFKAMAASGASRQMARRAAHTAVDFVEENRQKLMGKIGEVLGKNPAALDWQRLEKNLAHITAGMAPDHVLHPDELVQPPNTFARVVVGDEEKKYHAKVFPWGPGVKTPVHSHKVACTTVVLPDQARGAGLVDTTYLPTRPDGAEVKAVSVNYREPGSTTLDASEGRGNRAHRIENPTGAMVYGLHVYGCDANGNGKTLQGAEVKDGPNARVFDVDERPRMPVHVVAAAMEGGPGFVEFMKTFTQQAMLNPDRQPVVMDVVVGKESEALDPKVQRDVTTAVNTAGSPLRVNFIPPGQTVHHNDGDPLVSVPAIGTDAALYAMRRINEVANRAAAGETGRGV